MSDRNENTAHDCDEALEKLYRYLDSELDQASSEQIRAHLDECQDCSGSFDFERRLKKVVRDRLDERVPDRLVERVRAVIEAERSSSR